MRRAPPRAPRRCRGGSNGSRPRRRRARRCRSCRGSRGRRGCRAAGSRSSRASASPPGTEISTSASAATPCCGRDLGDRLVHHPPRHRVDRRLARRDRQARERHRADARARRGTRTPRRPRPRRTVATISAPCVTSGSSPASLMTLAPRPAARRACACRAQREGRRLAARQADRHRIGKIAGQQRLRTPPSPRPWRRRRSSSRGGAARPGGAGSGDERPPSTYPAGIAAAQSSAPIAAFAPAAGAAVEARS